MEIPANDKHLLNDLPMLKYLKVQEYMQNSPKLMKQYKKLKKAMQKIEKLRWEEEYYVNTIGDLNQARLTNEIISDEI